MGTIFIKNIKLNVTQLRSPVGPSVKTKVKCICLYVASLSVARIVINIEHLKTYPPYTIVSTRPGFVSTAATMGSEHSTQRSQSQPMVAAVLTKHEQAKTIV